MGNPNLAYDKWQITWLTWTMAIWVWKQAYWSDEVIYEFYYLLTKYMKKNQKKQAMTEQGHTGSLSSKLTHKQCKAKEALSSTK